MTEAISIELFENLAQREIDGRYYDLHNDYYCERVVFQEKKLFLLFIKADNVEDCLSLIFSDVEMSMFNFSKAQDLLLTIDNIYRGRVMSNGILVDALNNKGYFYMEFVEGFKCEFWAKSLSIEQEAVIPI